MRKSLMAAAGALAVAGMLQGCASVPGSYYDSRYQPPPGYILVPAPEGYGSYYGPFYNPYNWDPGFSTYYLDRGNPFYFPFYAPFIYGFSHRHPRPQPEQPPSPHVNPAPKAGGTSDPRFTPPPDLYRDFRHRSPHNSFPDDRHLLRPPNWRDPRPERPATIQPPNLPRRAVPAVQTPIPAPAPAPKPRRHGQLPPGVQPQPPR